MKIIAAIANNGKPFMIPDCSRDELPEFFKAMGYKVGIEIGVWEGEFTEKFCVAGLKMYGVDPWVARGRDSQFQQEARYGRTLVKLSPYKCFLIRKTSMEAVKDFDNNSLDFIYIDGLHKFKNVYEDITEWSKKVKSGGVVAGHDYICTDLKLNAVPIKHQLHLQVQAAVDRYIAENNIENFYILGRSKPLAEEIQNDTMLSWFWFKP